MIQQLLNDHVLDPKNPEKLYALAREYDRLEQGAMAVSLYLKTADLANDLLLQYKSMLGVARCYDRQGNRRFTVEGALLDAVTLLPERPEAYYFLADFYAQGRIWKQGLFYANMGLKAKVCDDIDVGYPGRKALAVKAAISKWQVTGQQDGRQMLFDLKFKTLLDTPEWQSVSSVLSTIGYPNIFPYTADDFNRFKFLFPGLEKVYNNYSKYFQDLFVLSVLNGKKNGTYIEIGSGDPFIANNTALLEKEFNWQGISIDISPALCYKFKENRRNTVICADATQIGYMDLLDKHCFDHIIDYLQVNCGEATGSIIKNIPFDSYKFRVITLEHNSHMFGTDYRDSIREILKDKGYLLLANDIAPDEYGSCEDWFVNPELVNINTLMKTNKNVNFVWDYFMEELTAENERVV